MVTVNPRTLAREETGRSLPLHYAALFGERGGCGVHDQENPSATSFGRAQLLRLFGNASSRLSRIRQGQHIIYIQSLLAADPGSIDIPAATDPYSSCCCWCPVVMGASAIVSEILRLRPAAAPTTTTFDSDYLCIAPVFPPGIWDRGAAAAGIPLLASQSVWMGITDSVPCMGRM
jgi:hypothetical protein